MASFRCVQLAEVFPRNPVTRTGRGMSRTNFTQELRFSAEPLCRWPPKPRGLLDSRNNAKSHAFGCQFLVNRRSAS